MQARINLQRTKLSKSGHNKFAGYKYFELGDFLPTVQEIFTKLDLCGYVSFYVDTATLTIIDTETGQSLSISSPMATASLKGAHDIQNLGAVQTYLRRYLWVTAMEIVEHDALDAVLGSDSERGPQGRNTQGRRQREATTEAAQQPRQVQDDDESTNEFVSAAYETMAAIGLNKIGVKTLLALLKVAQLQDVPQEFHAKILKMLTPDYAKLLNVGRNSRGQQIIELPEENVDAPSLDELEKEADEVF